MTTPTQYAAPAGTHPRIDGVKVKPLKTIADERGWLMEILRADETDLFSTFGQAYVSATYPGVVKAWHFHRQQVDNFACLVGMIKLVLVDTRDASPTKGAVNEFFIGTEQRLLGRIPGLVELYPDADPDEYRLVPRGSLPYDWTRHDG